MFKSSPSFRRARRWSALIALAATGLAVVPLAAGTTPATASVSPAAQRTGGGWTTSASAPVSVSAGQTVSVAIRVSSASTRSGLVDLEIVDARQRVWQQVWDAQSFTAGQTRTFTASWTVPSSAAAGVYTVNVGMFGAGWSGLQHWNQAATTFQVTSGPAPTTTTRPPTTTAAPTTTTRPPTTTAAPTTTTRPPTTTAAPTTTVPATTTPPTTAPPSGRFTTLPPGSALPSDATCASRVRGAAENRADNAGANATRGQSTPASPNDLFTRVTGNYTGTTDQLIQWAACKWGFDEDVVRAQVAVESWWHQNALGDWTTNAAACAPGHGIGADGRPGECPESFGLLQVRYLYWKSGFPAAISSSAYNLDYALAARRSCFEGRETWLGGSYGPGDMWGCMGLWFSGRWYDAPAQSYIAKLQSYYDQRVWEGASFQNG